MCVCVCPPPLSLEYSHLLSLSQPFHLCTFPYWLILGLLLLSFPLFLPLLCPWLFFVSHYFCYIDILSLPLYRDTPLTAPSVTLSMTTDLRGKCKVPPHQEIKTLASSRCLTPLTSLIFPHPVLHTRLPNSPLYHSLFCFLFSFLQLLLATLFSYYFTCLIILSMQKCRIKFSFSFNYIILSLFLTAEVRQHIHLI